MRQKQVAQLSQRDRAAGCVNFSLWLLRSLLSTELDALVNIAMSHKTRFFGLHFRYRYHYHYYFFQNVVYGTCIQTSSSKVPILFSFFFIIIIIILFKIR